MGAVLEVTSGLVIAADPATLYADARPLPPPALPLGAFPVTRTPGLVRVEFAAGPPDRHVELPGFPTASGLGCLLDADALAGFTDLGDEPVDEFELLAERLAAGDPAGLVSFGGLVAFAAPYGTGAIRLGCAGAAVVRLDCEIIT